jgi:hypothetical protein
LVEAYHSQSLVHATHDITSHVQNLSLWTNLKPAPKLQDKQSIYESQNKFSTKRPRRTYLNNQMTILALYYVWIMIYGME